MASILGVGEVSDLINTVVSRIFPDKAAEAKAVLDAFEKDKDRQATLDKAQIDVNAVEAANPNLFVSGARPYLMWVCGAAFSWEYVIQPLFTYFYIIISGHPAPEFPQLDTGALTTLLFGLLGLGTMRTVEKIQGVARK